MKSLVIAILEHVPATEKLIRSLSKEGYNGTVINAAGLHHVLPKFSDQSAAVSLATMVEDVPSGNITFFVVVDEDKKDALKAEIRNATDGFKSIKGGMLVYPVADAEGFGE